jgi:hypothetical protein
MAWWGPVIYETYGGTEVGAVMLSTPQDWLAHPGSVGRPAARIAIYGDDGSPVAPGGIGEIFVRQPALADFTYLNQDENRRQIERDGLISVGNIGYMKDERLYLCDRRSDMVISGGVNIYPSEIEQALVQCPGVRDCAVFGIPDDDLGETLIAVVEAARGATISAGNIRVFLEQRIAKYKSGTSRSRTRCHGKRAGRSSSAGCAIHSGRLGAAASNERRVLPSPAIPYSDLSIMIASAIPPATHMVARSRSIAAHYRTSALHGRFNWSAQHTNLLAKMECGP